ncbi:uncharacterized protein LOC110906811 [Helianthus annuus]|uniref:uncharacterized protein LOC110906811 n=1 Tax=Helianthus annuus TaxID=4232 RepID=UPI000B909484|nr:uncharacterized protein LOC110906811 [Helianthus annuus]
MANAIMEDYKVLGRKEEETARLRAEAEVMAQAAREGAEQLEKEKVAFEKQNQEVTNLKAVNAALVKETAAAEAAAKEAKEVEARGAKALEEADADRNNLNKAVQGLKNRVTIIEEVTARAAEAEAQEREATKARDSLVSSLDQLKADRDWMRDHGIGHIVGTILDTPENASAVNELKEHAREAAFKADTEARYVTAVNTYNSVSISAIEDIDKCLEAEDYVDRLQLLYDDPEEEEEPSGGAKGDVGNARQRDETKTNRMHKTCTERDDEHMLRTSTQLQVASDEVCGVVFELRREDTSPASEQKMRSVEETHDKEMKRKRIGCTERVPNEMTNTCCELRLNSKWLPMRFAVSSSSSDVKIRVPRVSKR